MFYIVNTDGQIVDITETRPTEHSLKELAEEIYLDLYVIEGDRAGLEYTRPDPQEGHPSGWSPNCPTIVGWDGTPRA